MISLISRRQYNQYIFDNCIISGTVASKMCRICKNKKLMAGIIVVTFIVIVTVISVGSIIFKIAIHRLENMPPY